MIPVGIFGGAVKASSGPKLPIRSKATFSGLVTSVTATFDEPTPLNSTHLLIAVVQVAAGYTLTVPSGWVEATVGWTGITPQTRVFARQADGVVNSFTVSWSTANARARVQLFAFTGFVSTTPLHVSTQNNAASVTSAVLTPSATPSGSGVLLHALSLSNNVTTQSIAWTNGFTDYAGTDGYMETAFKDYTGSGGSYSTTASWGAGNGRAWWGLCVVYPLS